MSKDNLQTIIVSKNLAKSRSRAEAMALPYARRIYTSRETSSSWRFRQRPPTDFIKDSFRSFPLPNEPGIVLVYGKLKRSQNPADQRWLQFGFGSPHDVAMQEWDFWMRFDSDLNKVRSTSGLRQAIGVAEKRKIKTSLIKGMIERSVAARARRLSIAKLGESTENDNRIYRLIRDGRIGNPGKKNRSKKRKDKKNNKNTSRKYIKLRSPKEMPSPGHCSWLGSIVEWSWFSKRGDSYSKKDKEGFPIWEPGSEWMFMWSPKYKAVVSMKTPKNMYKEADVMRYGGAAKMFEVFMDRPADATFEMDFPKVPLQKVGKKARHIVYRSDKWSAQRLQSDYIHPFGRGVKIYCGPTLEKPEVFICFGGKLTLTKRGLVW